VTVFDRYILREWLKILGLIMCATVGLLLIQALYDNLSELLRIGAPAWDIVSYYVLVLPSYFSIVLPIALLLSLLFVLSKLHRSNEITAMRSAGLNVFSATRSLWFASVLFCGVSLLLNARIVPWSVETSRLLKDELKYRAEEKKAPGVTLGLVTSVTFDNRRIGRLWYMNRYSRYTKIAYGVTVSAVDQNRRELTRLMAREGVFDPVKKSWVFTDGREMWFDVESGELVRTVVFARKAVPQFDEDPTLMVLIDRSKPGELSLFELRRIVNYFEAEVNPKMMRYAVRYYGVLADTLAPLIILGIAIPFSLAGVRVSPTVGVSKSIGLFFAYYLLNTLATNLGGNGFMDPLWAAWLPNIVLIGVATFFFGRMR
jgi:lipopolysaccharide export system permease protein